MVWAVSENKTEASKTSELEEIHTQGSILQGGDEIKALTKSFKGQAYIHYLAIQGPVKGRPLFSLARPPHRVEGTLEHV